MWLPFLFVLLAQSMLAQSMDFSTAGRTALDQKDYPRAIDAFRKAIAADPADYAAHFNLGFAYTLAGEDADAVPEFQKVLELHPGVYEAQVNLANSLFRLNRFAAADAGYRAALLLKPGSASAESGLGRSLAREENFGGAELHYRKAMVLDPSYKDFLLELASLYEQRHHSDEAMVILHEFPSNPTAQEHLGALLLQAGKSAEAIAPLEFAVAQAPTAANRLELAQAYTKEKQPAKAEPLAAAALAAAPDDNEVRMFYRRLLRDQRKFPEAAAQFQAVATRDPQSARAWSELAGVLLVAEQYPQALAALDRVRALGAETPPDLFFRGLAFDHLNQAKQALENYNGFLAASKGAFPNQEWQARGRVVFLEKELGKR